MNALEYVDVPDGMLWVGDPLISIWHNLTVVPGHWIVRTSSEWLEVHLEGANITNPWVQIVPANTWIASATVAFIGALFDKSFLYNLADLVRFSQLGGGCRPLRHEAVSIQSTTRQGYSAQLFVSHDANGQIIAAKIKRQS